MNQQALSLLRRDSVANADMIYPILRGTARILQADEDGVILIDEPSALCFADLPDTDGSVQKLMALRQIRGYALHSDALADRFGRMTRVKRTLRLKQVVYEGKTAPHVARVCSIRKLQEADAPEFERLMPYDDMQELHALILSGNMYGAFIGDMPVGRIGLHAEGCMGLLAVDPDFRRRGVGEALESHLIRELLSAGRTPYGQVVRENTASMTLCREMGFTFSDGEITMLYR